MQNELSKIMQTTKCYILIIFLLTQAIELGPYSDRKKPAPLFSLFAIDGLILTAYGLNVSDILGVW